MCATTSEIDERGKADELTRVRQVGLKPGARSVRQWGMPPRFAYWTILIDNTPTAFRAHDAQELLPTLAQLKRTNPNVVMKWFSGGQLWDSPEAARDARRAPKVMEKRGADWRPGGQHRDPRARFDKNKKPKPAFNARGREGAPPFGEKRPGDKPPFAKPWARKPFGGKPGGDRARFGGGKPGGDRARFGGGKPGGDRPRFGGKPSGNRPPFGGKPGGDRARFGGGKPGGDRPRFGGKPGGSRPPFGGKPGGDRARFGGKPAGDRPRFAKPGGDRPPFPKPPFKPAAETPRPERPAPRPRRWRGGRRDDEE